MSNPQSAMMWHCALKITTRNSGWRLLTTVALEIGRVPDRICLSRGSPAVASLLEYSGGLVQSFAE